MSDNYFLRRISYYIRFCDTHIEIDAIVLWFHSCSNVYAEQIINPILAQDCEAYGGRQHLADISFSGQYHNSKIYVFRCVSKRKTTDTNYSNLITHIHSAYPNYRQLVASEGTDQQNYLHHFSLPHNQEINTDDLITLLNVFLIFQMLRRK